MSDKVIVWCTAIIRDIQTPCTWPGPEGDIIATTAEPPNWRPQHLTRLPYYFGRHNWRYYLGHLPQSTTKWTLKTRAFYLNVIEQTDLFGSYQMIHSKAFPIWINEVFVSFKRLVDAEWFRPGSRKNSFRTGFIYQCCLLTSSVDAIVFL